MNKFKFKTQQLIWLIVFWQFISVGLMAVGVWPANVALVNSVLLGLFILFAKPYQSVLLLVLSIPFYIILPNTVVANLPMWRPLFVELFAVWFVHLLIAQRAWLQRLFTIQRWTNDEPLTGTKLKEIVINSLKRIDSRFMPWDKVAVLFIVLAALSLLIARFPGHGAKQILFLLNVYLLYIVVINVVTDRDKLKELIRYTLVSLGIMVALGYIQYIGTMFSQPYYFWQYWAVMVSNLYYGTPLANVLVYSNSWFSYSGGSQALRMFGILPDTHAFGVVCIFALAFLAPYLKSWRKNKWYLVVAIVLVAFAIMADGTRGVWIAMLAPLLLTLLFIGKKLFVNFSKALLGVYFVVIILFALSPFISQGLNFIRTYDVNDDFLSRAGSIYDLNESSNAGRLEIWKSSVKYAALHPFGVGYGNFIVSFIDRIPERMTYEQLADQKNLRYNLPAGFVTAHSLYLQLLVELGFAGLLAFILFWWEYFERLFQFLSSHLAEDSYYSNLVISLAMAFLWLLAYGVFDLTILNDRVLQYLFLSLAISGLLFAKYDSLNDIIVED